MKARSGGVTPGPVAAARGDDRTVRARWGSPATLGPTRCHDPAQRPSTGPSQPQPLQPLTKRDMAKFDRLSRQSPAGKSIAGHGGSVPVGAGGNGAGVAWRGWGHR
eukprot:756461-Hanusia_phi.AAC.5